MRNNNAMKKDGSIGHVDIVVHYQGPRGVVKEVYDDLKEFNDNWMEIEKFWARPKLTKTDRQLIDAFLERSAHVDLNQKNKGDDE